MAAPKKDSKGSADFEPRAPSDTLYQAILTELRQVTERLVIAGIHEQELAEQAESLTADFTTLLNNLAEGIVITNPSGQIVLANPFGRQLLGLPDRPVLSVPVDWLTIEMRNLGGHPLRLDERPLSRALRGEVFAEYEVQVILPDGNCRNVIFTGNPLRSASGEIIRAILIFRDVTELRQLERQREEYLSLITHDLRTPLTTILGRAELLTRQAARTPLIGIAESAMAILRNAQRMEAMLRDLVETTRLEAGRAVLNNEPLDLFEVARSVVGELIPPTEQPRILVEETGPVPPVLADRKRIERVVMNLVTNALKFSAPDLPIEICVSDGDHDVTVSVTDYGIGIAPEEQEHLFDRYFQARAGNKREGLGLGLYLSHLIVEAHGGQIWATSTLGVGSTFSFSLPIQPAEKAVVLRSE